MDVVFRLLLGEKILGKGSRGREGLGIRVPREGGGLREAKEMIISKRTVGLELLSEPGAKRPYLQGGRGPGRGESVPDFRGVGP